MLAVFEPIVQLECAVTSYSWVKVQPIILDGTYGSTWRLLYGTLKGSVEGSLHGTLEGSMKGSLHGTLEGMRLMLRLDVS